MYAGCVFLPMAAEQLIPAPFHWLAIFSADNVNGYDDVEVVREREGVGRSGMESRGGAVVSSIESYSLCVSAYICIYINWKLPTAFKTQPPFF